MEKQDVLDENGKPTGVSKARREIDRDGDWHLSIHCWVINSKGELLIQKRSAQKDSSPNMWDISFAGHVQAGSTPVEEGIREAKEELGLNFSEKDFQYIFTARQSKTFPGGNYFNNEFNPVYLIKKDLVLADIRLQKEEVSEVKYIPWQELGKRIDANDPSFAQHPDEYRKLFEYLRKNK